MQTFTIEYEIQFVSGLLEGLEMPTKTTYNGEIAFMQAYNHLLEDIKTKRVVKPCAGSSGYVITDILSVTYSETE